MTDAAKKRYFEEVAIQLQQQGLRTLPIVQDELPVMVGGVQICTVTSNGGVRYKPNIVTVAEKNLIEHQVTDIVQEVTEYMAMMETSPPAQSQWVGGRLPRNG